MASNGNLPLATLGEALEHLRRPVPPEAVSFKVQSEAARAGLVVGYIDSRVVYERLNQVVGERWSYEFRPLADGLRPTERGEGQPSPLYVVCRLTVCGVTREDVGEGADPKAAFSDAVKRAAVPFGIGRFLYAMRTPWLSEGERDCDLRRSGGARRRLSWTSAASAGCGRSTASGSPAPGASSASHSATASEDRRNGPWPRRPRPSRRCHRPQPRAVRPPRGSDPRRRAPRKRGRMHAPPRASELCRRARPGRPFPPP